ncbi:MAG: diaminopimelate decarboxylase [Elusimicrobia bacterium]|nr:diaminopimelate decarboxylase [Elusimicrobiota bacterium]
MDYFRYREDELFAEDVPLKFLAGRFGTPLYVYSKKTIVRHLRAFKRSFSVLNPLICFAYKANYNRKILEIMKKEGFGADCVSMGELKLAKKIGVPSSKIVFNGNGKTEEEIEMAVGMKIKMFNVDSVEELLTISRIARKRNTRANIAFRVNPEIEVPTHPHIATALKQSKFGIPLEDAFSAYELAKQIPSIAVLGVHFHIGSQITEVGPFLKALRKTSAFVRKLGRRRIPVKFLNIGGGIGVRYHRELPADLDTYAREFAKCLKIPVKIIMEPGRAIIANAAVLLAKVVATKKTRYGNFAVVDAGMNDLVRPSMYGSYHEIEPVKIFEDRKKTKYSVVGPVCESGDIFAKKAALRQVFAGELLAFRSAGAYGYSMSSNYNLRSRPAEVLVDGKNFIEIRKREKTEDLI